MRYYSTNGKSEAHSFGEALLKGLAPDKGLYMPEIIPTITGDKIHEMSSMAYYEIAFRVISKFLDGEIGDSELLALVKDAYSFDVPLEHLEARSYIMRLDQGPTSSFKDFAARMMARLMNYYLKSENRSLQILTATSGDTGSAIANAFYKQDRIKVLVLYPEKEVSERQRKQMTTLGGNIRVIAVDGKFDDCQALVKEAFSDPNLADMNLSSANSINIGRLIPQAVYYFYSYAKLREKSEDVIFSIPSGNFGNMMGGMIAKKMGLPVSKFVIAVNENDEFPAFLNTGSYKKIDPSINCLSSAMNVGHPSNLARLVDLYGGWMDEKGHIHKEADMEEMRRDIFSVSVSDAQTRENIREAWDKHRILLEPHGSVGWKGIKDYSEDAGIDHCSLCITLETAHPAKFPEEIRSICGFDPELPDSLKGLEDKTEFVEKMGKDYKEFKSLLLKDS